MSGAPRQFETILGYASGYLARNFGLEIVPLRPKLEAGNQSTSLHNAIRVHCSH